MYIPKYNEEVDQDLHVKLIRENPLGTIITYGPNGITANHFPFIVEVISDNQLLLKAHYARVNPQNEDLRSGNECLIVFQGHDAYETPNWYKETKATTGKSVPTWDFTTVHVYGIPKVIDDPEWIRNQVIELSALHEQSQSEPWSIDDAPENYVNLLQKAIYGLEINVTRVQGKWKVAQKLSDADNRGVVEGYRNLGTEKGKVLSQEVESAKLRYDEKKLAAKQ